MTARVRGLTVIEITSDLEQGTSVISRIADLAGRFTGVLSWEVFGDEDSGTLLLISSYESEDAVAEWEDGVTQAGLRPDIAENLHVVADYALTPITGEPGLEAVRSGTWIQARLIASK